MASNFSKSKGDETESSGKDDIGASLIYLEKLNLGPRKKLLVLDLNGLLVHRAHLRDISSIPSNLRPDLSSGNFRVFKRPFCNDFVKFCFERFEVGLWSSAMEHNINVGVLTTVLGEYRSRLLFVWGQKECTDSGFKSLEKKEKPIFLKELRKLWEQKRQYSSSNTLLIDDDPFKALLNPPNTAIFPPKYKVENADRDKYLGPKGELQRFLDGLSDAEDVPSYVKKHPFGQPAVTPSHANWDYYSKIIRRFRIAEDSGSKQIQLA